MNSNPAVCSLLEQHGYQVTIYLTIVIVIALGNFDLYCDGGNYRYITFQPQHRSGQSLQPPVMHQHDEITSLDTVRAILAHRSSHSRDNASRKHQTSHMSQEESEETDL